MKIERLDFSVEFIKANFIYDSIHGVIREKATGKHIGNPNSQDGGTRIEFNGKTMPGARVAWILQTGKAIAAGMAVTLRQRAPGHYSNRINNLYLVDVMKDPNYFG